MNSGQADSLSHKHDQILHLLRRTEVLDCSALDGHNVRQIFRTFLTLAKINKPLIVTASAADDGGLKRNLSAYGRLKSPRYGANST